MRNDQIAVSVVKPEEKPRTFERVEASSDSLISQARTLGDFPDIGAEYLSMPPSPGRGHSRGAADSRHEKALPTGRELFERLWVKNDPRGHGGDGLGPVFNGQSCVACHNLGGSGGAGTVGSNIEIATATDSFNGGACYSYSFSMDFGAGRFESRIGGGSQESSGRLQAAGARFLSGIHPGFRDSNSVVLHRFGTDPAYHAWRESVPGQHRSVVIQSSERNPPALFGSGLIDAIPDEAIEAAAKRKISWSAQVNGRVSRLKDGRVGRFGWKAQTATLAEFVRSAAAGEIGLEIPDRHQAADPRTPGVAAVGLDMNEGECDDLVEYVRSLSIPMAIKPADQKRSAQFKAGEAAFKSIGCAVCHMPKLGEVDGIYSDLLLHDMGPQLADADAYTVFAGDQLEAKDLAIAGRASYQKPSIISRMANAAALGNARFCPLHARRTSRHHFPGDHAACRRRCDGGAALYRVISPTEATNRDVSDVACSSTRDGSLITIRNGDCSNIGENVAVLQHEDDKRSLA